jgi:hypothetical protein
LPGIRQDAPFYPATFSRRLAGALLEIFGLPILPPDVISSEATDAWENHQAEG